MGAGVSRSWRHTRVEKGASLSHAKKFFAGTIFVQSPRSLERQLSGDQIGTANDRSGAALGQIDLRADNGAELRSVLGGKATVNDVRFCADAAR
jgi:hypothetical protein